MSKVLQDIIKKAQEEYCAKCELCDVFDRPHVNCIDVQNIRKAMKGGEV